MNFVMNKKLFQENELNVFVIRITCEVNNAHHDKMEGSVFVFGLRIVL